MAYTAPSGRSHSLFVKAYQICLYLRCKFTLKVCAIAATGIKAVGLLNTPILHYSAHSKPLFKLTSRSTLWHS